MALIQPPSSDLPYLLHGDSVLSLFPRTFKDAPTAIDSDDIDSVHNYMKSMALRSPDNLFEKAKGIVHGGSELLNSKLASLGESENDNEVAAAKGRGNHQERRPALGHKRARFSLKPNISQPSVGLEPILDIDQLQDPVDFFSAYEKLEYAKEEMQRQTGGKMTEKNEYNTSTNPRRRRPGILGKSVSYRHHYSSMVSENDDTLLSSQETLRQDNLSPYNFDSQQETTNPDVELQERELAGSITNSENRVNELLDELLSRNIENLDGDGALSLLQEHLQIKPVDVDKYLPDFSDIGRADFLDLEEEWPKSRKALSDIQNVMKRLSDKTPMKTKQVAENRVQSIASPTPLKSPFAALSLLNKRISQSNPFGDPFSALDIDISSYRSPPSLEDFNKQSDQLDSGKELSISGKLKSPVEDESTKSVVANTNSKKVIAGDSIKLVDKSVNVYTNSIYIDIRSSGSHGDLVDHNENDLVDDSANPNADTNMWTNGANKMAENAGNHGDLVDHNENKCMDDSARPIADTNMWTNEANKMKVNAGNILRETVSSTRTYMNVEEASKGYSDGVILRHGLNDIEENTMQVEDMQQFIASLVQPDVNIDDSTSENLKNSQSLLGQSDLPVAEDLLKDVQQITSESGPEQQNKECTKSSLNDRSKARRPREQRERKALSRRQSLIASGTYWESGVRRSKRIKTRPLEYWKGERFLYGRVHESLTTVIGLKFISPSKGAGEPTFRVTSYVSDKHKELVELAALH